MVASLLTEVIASFSSCTACSKYRRSRENDLKKSLSHHYVVIVLCNVSSKKIELKRSFSFKVTFFSTNGPRVVLNNNNKKKKENAHKLTVTATEMNQESIYFFKFILSAI